jgi:hypothetical protein
MFPQRTHWISIVFAAAGCAPWKESCNENGSYHRWRPPDRVEFANTLLQQGWRVIGIGRSAQRCEEAKERLQALLPGADIRFITADLMQQAQVHGAAEEILAVLAQQKAGDWMR